MKSVKCDSCGSGDYSILYGGYRTQDNEFNIVVCNNCGLTYTNPQPSDDEILSYYGKDYYGTNNIRFKGAIEKFIRFRRVLRANRVAKFVKSGRVLDVGCGRGIFLNEMRKRGYETCGTELSEIAATYAREVLKLNVLIGQLEDLKLPANHFDAVILYHVLEHFSNPSRKLQEVQRILRPGGLLLISLPNIQSLQAKIFKIFWFHLDIPRHYFHFSLNSLNKMLPPTNWEILATKRFSLEYGPFGWVQSALNVLFGNDNVLYNMLKEKASGTFMAYTKKRFSVFRWTMTLLNMLIGALLIIPSIALSMLLSLTDCSENVEIYYRKTR